MLVDQFQIFTGYNIEIVATLKKVINGAGATFAIPTDGSATVKAALISEDRSQLLAGPWVLDSAAPGADWPNSKIVIEGPAADIDGLEPGAVAFEIQVDDAGKKLPFFIGGDLLRGHIE